MKIMFILLALAAISPSVSFANGGGGSNGGGPVLNSGNAGGGSIG